MQIIPHSVTDVLQLLKTNLNAPLFAGRFDTERKKENEI